MTTNRNHSWTKEKQDRLNNLYKDWQKSSKRTRVKYIDFCKAVGLDFDLNFQTIKEKIKQINTFEKLHLSQDMMAFLGEDKFITYVKFLEFDAMFFSNKNICKKTLVFFGYSVEQAPINQYKNGVKPSGSSVKKVKELIAKPSYGKRNIYYDIADKIGATYSELTGQITKNGYPVCQSVITKARNEVLYG